MSKIVAIVFGLAFIAATCKSELSPGDGRFYVKGVEEHLSESKYQLIQVEGNGQTWITAAPGRYHVGDTLQLQPSRP